MKRLCIDKAARSAGQGVAVLRQRVEREVEVVKGVGIAVKLQEARGARMHWLNRR